MCRSVNELGRSTLVTLQTLRQRVDYGSFIYPNSSLPPSLPLVHALTILSFALKPLHVLSNVLSSKSLGVASAATDTANCTRNAKHKTTMY